MANINEPIPNLIGGVSQQSPSTRLSSQAEEQINGMSSVSQGLTKRMPTEFIAELMDAPAVEPYQYLISRDSEEKYIAMFSDTVRVFDLDGVEQTVTVETGALPYLTGDRSSYKALTMKDTVLLLNTAQKVSSNFNLPSTVDPTRGLFVVGVNYGVEYKVRRDGVEIVTHTTGDSGVATSVSTDEVAQAIYDDLVAEADARFAYELQDNQILITQISGTEVEWDFSDSFGDTYATLVKDEMEDLTGLPAVYWHGEKVAITGSAEDEGATLYLEYQADAGSGYGTGAWVEVAAEETFSGFLNTTMPCALTRNNDGTFTFDTVDWEDRTAGDADSAPMPSFVDTTINDAYVDRNRLCLVHEGGVVMSRARYPFAFFRKTAATVVDDDPIDIEPSGSEVANLRSAVAHRKQVLLFGDLRQYAIDTDNLLAGAPPAILPISSYSTEEESVQATGGQLIYFTSGNGTSVNVHEMSIVSDQLQAEANSVTKHIASYIPTGVRNMALTTNADVMLVSSEGEADALFVYNYYWRGSEKLQSSWSKWKLPAGTEVKYVGFIQDTAYLVLGHSGKYYLEKMDIAEGRTDDGVDFIYHADRRVDDSKCTVTYDVGSLSTTIELPYTPTEDIFVVSTGGDRNAGVEASISNITGNTITVVGDWSAAEFFVGEAYEFLYDFTKPTLKTQASNGAGATITGGRLQIDRFTLTYSQTGYFDVTVSAPGKSEYNYVFNAAVLGETVLGAPRIEEGDFSFRVKEQAKNAKITIRSKSFMPCSFTSAGWSGRFKRRTR